jgi:hypothetical protein
MTTFTDQPRRIFLDANEKWNLYLFILSELGQKSSFLCLGRAAIAD